MVPTIPPEIWLRTALFIPSSTLRNIYSVNSVFLDLALNERYSDTNLAIRWNATTAKFLKHLSLPHIARRVRRLTLSSNWIESNMYLDPSEEIPLRTMIAWFLPFDLGRFIDPIAFRISDIKMCNALMENTVVNFSNVSSLIIVEPSVFPCDNQPLSSPLLVNTYTTCASNLRTLSLLMPRTCANFNALFPQNPSVLTSLEEVTLSFSSWGASNANAKAASTFFQAISSTLTSLDISFHGTSEPSPLLQTLSCEGGKITFPKLTRFSLSYLKHPASPDLTLMQFLNQHADTLKHLRLQHTKTSPFVSQSHPLLLPVLPRLETLNILHGLSRNHQELVSSEGLDVALSYVQRSRSTLTSLTLTYCRFTLHDLGKILDLLGQESSKSTKRGGLKSLTVTVQVLSPQMVDMIAEKLPQLERLKVDFADLRSQDGPWTIPDFKDLTHEDIDSFLLEMRTRSYSMWSLRSFGIAGAFMRLDMAMAILTPLALCIPHLVEIDGPFVKMWREPGSTWMTSECEYH